MTVKDRANGVKSISVEDPSYHLGTPGQLPLLTVCIDFFRRTSGRTADHRLRLPALAVGLWRPTLAVALSQNRWTLGQDTLPLMIVAAAVCDVRTGHP